MKSFAAVILIAALSVSAQAKGGGGHGGGHSSHSTSPRSTSKTGEHWTTGHNTRTGTYVQGHFSTNPNATQNDNYSTIGSVNPHTGEAGTKPRDEDPK